MFMNRFFGLCIILALAACGDLSGRYGTDWIGDYTAPAPSTPTHMQYGRYNDTTTDTHRMAVLLPLSGDNASVGRQIRTSIELATLQSAPDNLSVTFYDTARDAGAAIDSALAETPEIIIGPIFAGDARILRDKKPETIPALAFTSDETAVGHGVLTMALMPTNSVEAIVNQIASDRAHGMIILAPDTESGKLMAGTARTAAQNQRIPVNGIFYYKPMDSESIKSAASNATINPARTAAHTRAREILSDILINERLTTIEKSSLNNQLEYLSRTDTLGKLPYDAVLFLGNANDTKNLASFLRYYGVGARDAAFYGTALWDGDNIASDITMSGAKYATLPEISAGFTTLYSGITGTAPSRLAAIGYDTANMAIGMIYSNKTQAAYLLNPSGYIGTNGLFRLQPGGNSERALHIVATDGAGATHRVTDAPANFITPIYNIQQRHISPAAPMALETRGINALDYITIPERLRGKYKSKTYGAHTTGATEQQIAEPVTILPEDDSDIITSPEFTPVSLESVNRTYIDSVEIEE